MTPFSLEVYAPLKVTNKVVIIKQMPETFAIIKNNFLQYYYIA